MTVIEVNNIYAFMLIVQGFFYSNGIVVLKKKKNYLKDEPSQFLKQCVAQPTQ